MGLVLLHAAVLDPRLHHIAIDHVLESYRSLLDAPMPIGAPEDMIPGVLLKYDIPDLVHALGRRATVTHPLNGKTASAGLTLHETYAPVLPLTTRRGNQTLFSLFV